MAQEQNCERILGLQNQFNLNFLPNYINILESIDEDQIYEIGDMGKYLYGPSDLAERNSTYEVQQYEPDYFLIGQDGDLGFFIKKAEGDSSMYSNDLGAIGSIEMEKQANDIVEFIRSI